MLISFVLLEVTKRSLVWLIKLAFGHTLVSRRRLEDAYSALSFSTIDLRALNTSCSSYAFIYNGLRGVAMKIRLKTRPPAAAPMVNSCGH